jgi:hypothetical protein
LAGVIWADLVREIGGDLERETCGDLVGKIVGDFAGDIRDDLAGEIRGDLAGEICGDLAGEIRGDLAGEIRSDSEGEIRGDFNGVFAVSSVLLLPDFLTGVLPARCFRRLSDVSLTTTIGASVMAAAFSKDFVSGSSVSSGRNFLGRPLRSTRFSTIVSVAVSCGFFFLISGKTISSPVFWRDFATGVVWTPCGSSFEDFQPPRPPILPLLPPNWPVAPSIGRRLLPIIKDSSSVSFFADLSFSPFRLAVVATGLTNTFSFGERLFIFLSFFRHFFVFRLTRGGDDSGVGFASTGTA